MRWRLAMCGFAVLACGGQSRSPAPLSSSAGGGSSGAVETTAGAGGSSAGSSSTVGGTAGAAGTAGAGAPKPPAAEIDVWTDVPEATSADTAECTAYRSADIAAACELSMPGSCSPDLMSYLRQIPRLDGYYARSGCGLTEIAAGVRPFIDLRVFDSDGKLVGYQAEGDLPFGACHGSIYQRGMHIAACPDVRECAIAPDAGETGQLCRCACPDPPPADGIAIDDPECGEHPNRPRACWQTLVEWGDLRRVTTEEGRVHTGCGATVIDRYLREGGVFSCIYGADEQLVGSRLTSVVGTGCPGVNGWQSGYKYSACTQEALCYFGRPVPDPKLPPPCGNYPYK